MRELIYSEKKMIHDFISLSICSVFNTDPSNFEVFNQNAKIICEMAGVEFTDDFANELWFHIDSIRIGVSIAKSLK